MLTERFVDSVRYAAALHAADTRKGGDVPYLGHLLAVSALVIDHEGSEDQAIAALLHDAAEDHGGEARLHHIADEFGAEVAAIVEHCSDSLEPEGVAKAPWWSRKVAYIERFDRETTAGPALLVATADKLDNAQLVGRLPIEG